MPELKEVVFESRDTLSDISSMLLLVDKTVSEIEHNGEDVAIHGTSSVLWSVVSKIQEMEKKMSEALKGGK